MPTHLPAMSSETTAVPDLTPPLGDRRQKVRLEVLGDLWATFEAEEPARILEISTGGSLIASPVAVALDSIQPLWFTVGGDTVVVQARVRHLRALPATDEEPARYAIGVEFLSPPPAVFELLPSQNS